MSFPRLEDGVFQSIENYLRLSEVIGESSWTLNVPSELLTFYEERTRRVTLECAAQIVGTESEETGTWLWAWANQASDLPPGMVEGVTRLKQRAAAEGAEAFFTAAEAFPLPRPSFGAEMAILCAAVGGYFTTYRCPYEGGAAYMVVESCPPAARLPADTMRSGKAILMGISNFSLDHRAAVEAYLGRPDDTGVYSNGIKLSYDAQGRVADMQYTLMPESVQAGKPPTASSPMDRLKGLFRRS